MNDQTLYVFQSEGVQWLSSKRDNQYGFVCQPNFGLIGDEMGLGKTAQALSTVKSLIQSGKKGLFLVPGATIIQWQKQFDRWINECEPDEFGMTSLIALRSSKAIIPQGMCCVMSHNLIARSEMIERLVPANFDFIVIDEIHKFGGEGTKRIKHLWALINLTKSHFESGRIGLSGTPVRNYAKEIYNVAKFLNFPDPMDKTRVITREAFYRKYLTWDGKALNNPPQFHSDFSPFYIRRTVNQVQKDLPEIRRTKLYTEITDPFIAAAYNNQLDLMENFMNHSSKIDSFSLLGYLIKLRHITGIAKAKEPAIIEPIKEYISGDNGAETQRKVVLGIHHHFVTTRLKRSIPEWEHYLIRGGMDGYEKERVKNAFINHTGGAICQLSIKAAGEGIDGLQYSGAHKMYVFEPQWNMQDILQLEKRIHRTGQTSICQIEYTVAVGTVDEFFWDLSEEKQRYTTQVEDRQWESNPAFLNELARRVVSNRLPTNQLKTYEDCDNPLESVYHKPNLTHNARSEQEIMEELLDGKEF